MPRHHRALLWVILLVAAVTALAACGEENVFSSSEETTTLPPSTIAETTTLVTTTEASTTTAESSTTSTVPLGCTTGPSEIPVGALSRQVIDVDGDGLPDTAWLLATPDGTVQVGIVTAAGGGAARLWDSASPGGRYVLVADGDGQLPVMVFADDVRMVQLWEFRDCALQDVLDAANQPFWFSMGYGPVGLGVECTEVGGAMHLVRPDIVTDDGTTVGWSRTVIDLADGRATEGATVTGFYTRPADDAAIARLHDVTCGSLTIEEDGLAYTQG
jgi:hypothetical protein